LQSWGDADELLRQIGAWERSKEKAEAAMQEAIDKAKAKAKAEAKELDGKIRLAALQLKVFCQERQADLGPKKSKQLNFGLLGFRWSTKVTLPRDKAAVRALLARLKELGRQQCIQVKETILKDEVKKLDEADLEELSFLGLRKQAGDNFFYETKREKIQEAA
jgi:phage host-nuclease inhibitor protein Gam